MEFSSFPGAVLESAGLVKVGTARGAALRAKKMSWMMSAYGWAAGSLLEGTYLKDLRYGVHPTRQSLPH